MSDGAIKMKIIQSLVCGKFRGKVFAKCCGYPACCPPPGVSEAFCSLDWAAAAAVKDNDVLAIVGMAGNLALSNFFFALVHRHKTTGSPRNLTIVTHGGNGGRGKLPGSLDDVLALPGLVSRFFVSHVDTHIFGTPALQGSHRLLTTCCRPVPTEPVPTTDPACPHRPHHAAKTRMLDPSDRLEVHVLPLGVMSLIYASMAEGGPPSVSVSTGVGTVFDPRVGRGTPLTPGLATQMVAVAAGGEALT